jgi:hypothetical protein
MKNSRTLLDASVYMHDLTNFTRLEEKPQFAQKRRMTAHVKEPSFLSLIKYNLLCFESFQLITDSSTSTIKHRNRHKICALQRFSYVSIPLSLTVPRFDFLDIFFLILKSNQHLICCFTLLSFSLLHSLSHSTVNMWIPCRANY